MRNGEAHSPQDAVRHILRKYGHFREKIETAEQFIDFCASGSTVSGRPYMMSCPGQPEMESRRWLMMELKRFRVRQTP